MSTPVSEFQVCSAACVLLLAASITPKVVANRARDLGLWAMTFAAILTLAAGLASQATASGGKVVGEGGTFRLMLLGATLLQSFALLFGLPRSRSVPAAVCDILFVEAGTLLVVSSDISALRVVGWIIALTPTRLTVADDGNFCVKQTVPLGFVRFQYASGAAFLAGSLLEALGRPNLAIGAALLLILAGILRQGIPPFHTPMLRFFEQSRLTYVIPFVASPVGILMIARGMQHLTGAGLTNVSGVIMAFAMASLVYLGLLTLAQLRCRGLLCYSALFSWTLSVICLAGGGRVNQGAGQLLVLGAMGTTLGFGLAVWLLEERLGELTSAHAGGLATRLPVLSAMFVLFGLASVGLPFSASFAGEDLWLHGLFEHSSAAGILVIVGWTLVAISIFRMYAKVFLGPSRDAPASWDLCKRERIAFAVALVVVFGIGLWPRLGLPPTLHVAHAASTAPTKASHRSSTRTIALEFGSKNLEE